MGELPRLRLLCGADLSDAWLLSAAGFAHYHPKLHEIRLEIGEALTNPLRGMLALLHEAGHAAHRHPPRSLLTTRRETLAWEAEAWRWVVRQIRRSRALTWAERREIRAAYGTYVRWA